MIETALYAMLNVLEFLIVTMSMVVVVWILALASFLIERRTKGWRK